MKTDRKKIIEIVVTKSTFAQEKKTNIADIALKDSIYNKNKTKVLNYLMKNFDKLYFQCYDKNFDQNLLLQRKNFKFTFQKFAFF